MSVLIGYWTNSHDDRASTELQQLLAEAVSGLRSNELRTSSSIAVHGRHATLPSAENQFATINVAGEGFAPDVWANVSPDSLVLGRDIFGRSQLFWTFSENAIWFSNRLQLLLKIVKDASVSVNGFYSYCCFSYVPAPHTPIRNVFAVRAGTELTWKDPHTAPQTRKLHDWREAEEQSVNEADEVARLRRLLEESVATQLARYSGEPVGVFLSGGLDSSVTAALLARAGARVRAYTLDLRADCFSEITYAEMVAGALGIPLTKVPITATTMRRGLVSTAERLDNPFGDGVSVPLAQMYERASNEVKTIFNGEGGDQLFAGWTNKPLIAASIYEEADAFHDSYMRTFHRLHGHEQSVFSDALLRQIDVTASMSPVLDALDPEFSSTLFHRLRRANLLLKGADNIQPRATNLGLSYDLDVRTLFCSLPLAEWTFGVSGDLWLRTGCEKYLLKRAFEDVLPAKVIWREKRGMGIPLTLWLNGPLRRWSQRQLRPQRLASEGLWQADLANRISAGELSGQMQGRRIGETLWLMLMWRAWRERFLQRESGPVKSSSIASWRFSHLAGLCLKSHLILTGL